MDIFERLGVRRVINAAGALTRLGGLPMVPEAIQAMAAISQCYVRLDELQVAVGQRIAELTGNEAAYVCSGAAAGLVLSVSACMTGKDLARIHRLPDTSTMRNEVIVQRLQRNAYDFTIRQTGARIIEVGSLLQNHPWELEAAMTERTAAIVHFGGAFYNEGHRYVIPLPQVIQIAHRHKVPVIVDAAGQLPPASNLSRYTREFGADVAVFSGGKALQGPQPSGFIVGRRDLVEAAELHGNPHHAIGRPMKVGKEEMIGLLVALEAFLQQDETAIREVYERRVAALLDGLSNVPGLHCRRQFPGKNGKPIPCVLAELEPGRLEPAELVSRLSEGDPPIETWLVAGGVQVIPEALRDEEVSIVVWRIREALTAATGPRALR